MMSETHPELLIATEVARWLRVRCSTVYAWAATGKLPSVRLNGAVRFVRADIQRWLNDCSNGAADSYPSSTHPIVLPKPTSVSRLTIQQAGARVIRRFTSRQPSQKNSPSGPLLPPAEMGERKDKP